MYILYGTQLDDACTQTLEGSFEEPLLRERSILTLSFINKDQARHHVAVNTSHQPSNLLLPPLSHAFDIIIYKATLFSPLTFYLQTDWIGLHAHLSLSCSLQSRAISLV